MKTSPYCPRCQLLITNGGTCGCTRTSGSSSSGKRRPGEWIARKPWTAAELQDLVRRQRAGATYNAIAVGTSHSRASVRNAIAKLRRQGVLPPARQSAR